LTRPIERVGEGLFEVAHIPVNPRDSTVLEPPRIASPFSFKLNVRSEETRAYYGPLGALILLPAVVWALVAVTRRRAPPILLVPALAIPLYIAGVALSTRYNEFNGRYLVPGVIFAMPLVALVYRRRALSAVVAGVAALSLVFVHLGNEVKPTGALRKPAIWDMSRAQAQSAKWPGMQYVIESVERNVPSDEKLGYALRYNDWVFPWYGPRLDRRLVKLPRRDFIEEAERIGLESVLVSGLVKSPPPRWKALTFSTGGWTLLLRRA
jgi:hypothetical protein